MTAEDQLIQQCLKGNMFSFEKLLSKYQNQMFSVCLSILKNRDEAQEATQDTFIKMHRSLHLFNSESKFSSWLYKIAYRTSLDYIRKRKPTKELDDSTKNGLMSDDVNSKLDAKELSQLLIKLLNLLPSQDAALIRMFYLEEMSIKELEEITGMGTSNVKVKLFRARKKLSELVKEEFVELEYFLHQ